MFIKNKYSLIITNREFLIIKRWFNNCNSLKPPWKALFFGSDNFSLTSLDALFKNYKSENLIECLDVVTLPNNRQIKKYAESNNLKIYEWPLEIKPNQYDVGFLVSFGRLIPKSIINAFPMGILNVHPSLLPRWRGASPVQYAIANGDTKTGISIMRIQPEKFDIGDIVVQKEIPLPEDATLPEIDQKLADLGADCLVSILSNLPEALKQAWPQSRIGVTLAPRLDASIAVVDFEKRTNLELYNLHRALIGYYPLLTKWKDTPVKLFEVKKCDVNVILDDFKPGYAFYGRDDKLLIIKCKEGCISVKKVGVLGKKMMSAFEFNNGYLKQCQQHECYFRT